MILEDFNPAIKNPDRIVHAVYDTFDHAKLDAILVELCAGVLRGQKQNPDHYGMVAAAIVDPKDRVVFALNYMNSEGQRVHAERAAIEEYVRLHGRIPFDSIIVTTCSPCSSNTHDHRDGPSCTQLIDDYGIRHVYVGFEDPTQNDTVLFNNRTFEIEQTDNQKIRDLCRMYAETFLQNEQLDEDWKKNVAAGALAGLTAFGGMSNAWSKDNANPDKAKAEISQQVKHQTQSPKAPTVQHKKVEANINDNAASQSLMKAAKAAGIHGDELAQFMAQCATETGGFKQFQEMNHDYSHYEPGTKIGAQLGNTQSGDGEKYHGRGYIQLTGRANYDHVGKAIGVDLVNKPDLMSNPDIAAKAAIYYWQHQVCPHVNDFSDTRACTKHINAGLRMLDQRQANFDAYQQAKLSEDQIDEILKLPIGDYGKKGTITPMKEPKGAKELPGGSGYKYKVQGDENRKEIMLFVDGNLAAELDIYRVNAPIPLWGVEAVVAEPEYQGKGLAMALYGIALSILKLTLKAGDSQTMNGQRQWLKLAQIPGVEVKGITSTPTNEYRPRSGEETLWTKGRTTVHTFPVGQGSRSMKSSQRGVGLYGNEESSMIAKWTGK